VNVARVVSMIQRIITYFQQCIIVLTAMFCVQRTTARTEVVRDPSAKPTALFLSFVGLSTASLTIALSFLPSPGEAHPALAIAKVVGGTGALVAVGAFLYWMGQKRARQGNA